MSKQTINIGIRANDGKGDSLRTAFTKTNNNFTELYNTVATNSNTSNTYYETNQELAQNAYNKANTASLGDILFDQVTMYSNTNVQVGNDHHGRRAWGMLFGQTTTQANNAYASSVAFDNENNILVSMTTQNEVTGLPQSTVIKFDPYGSIYWRKSVPASNVNNTLLPSYGDSVAVDANNNVYLLTNIPDDNSTLITKFNYLGQNVWNTLVSDSVGSTEIFVDDEEFPYYVGEHNLVTGLDITGELYFTHFNNSIANTHAVVALPNRGGVLVGSDNGYVHKFDTEGVYLWSNKVVAQGNTILSLTYDSSNNWYASTNTNIYKFRSNNQLIWEKAISGVTSPDISTIRYSNNYLYATGVTTDPSDNRGFITYKIHSSNGVLVWANSLQVEGANQSFSISHGQAAVQDDFIVGVGYARPMLPGSSREVAIVYELPIDGTLPGTYFGSASTTWGDFTYVTVPEATTVTSSTVGTGNTTVTIAENTNYAYTMNVVVYQNPSPENEQTITFFTQNWDFDANGTLVIPSSGSDLAIEFSGKGVANVGSITARTAAATWNGTNTYQLDVTALINKLTPQTNGGGSQYHLANGTEGQIMYLVPSSDIASNEYTSVSFDNARWTNGAGTITEASAVDWWLPFRGNNNTSHAVLTLIFTDGAWNLPHNNFD